MARARFLRLHWLWPLAVLGVLAVVTAALPLLRSEEDVFAVVRLGDKELHLEIADTPELQAKGLSGRNTIAENGGMLFLFDAAVVPTFWMKGMLVPIDILWVRSGRVVAINPHIEPPRPDTPEALLERLWPPEAVDAVVELRAGTAQSLGLRTGQIITILVP